MAIVLPVAVGGRPVGSAVLVQRHEARLFFATSLHLFGEGTDIRIAIPPHGGNCSRAQSYPLAQTPALVASIGASEPFADLAILLTTDASPATPPMPTIVSTAGLVAVGTEVVVLGYPFAPIGSLLETWVPATVTALARRQIATGVSVDELVLSAVAHPGSSGSAVIGKKDGVLYGIVRGALAPPEVLKIGDVPIATDTSVTFATCGHLLHSLLKIALKAAGKTHAS